ncbi:MAG: hypothetical protein WBN66_02300 [Smithella sp.]
MGKGTIISHIADGQYNVTVNYNSAAITATLSTLGAKETGLIALIAAETDETKKKLLRLYLLSVQKRIAYLNDTDNVPVDTNITAWCADLTDDLTGEVGLIEIGRERANGVNIQPGYNSNAAYDLTRDGHLTPLMAQSAAATFYNLAMLPGFQKWKPMFRYGQITAIDYEAGTCSVSLEDASSSQQSLNINQEFAIAAVPFRYMNCNQWAFNVDDFVIVEFTNYDFEQPVVIGFKEEPQACCWIEEWDGPALTTKWPWAGVFQAWIDDPTPPTLAGPVVTLSGGALNIDIAQTPTGEGWYDSQYVWKYDLTAGPGFIREGATKVILNAVGGVPRYDLNYGRNQYKLQIWGKTAEDADVYFNIYWVNNSNAYPFEPLIGCTDEAHDPTDWFDYYGNNNWSCSVANNNAEFLTLPVAGTNIVFVQLYIRVGVNSVPPYPDFLNAVGVSINHIQIC